MVYLLLIFMIDDGAVADVDFLDALQTLDTFGFDGRLAVVAHHATDVDVLELGRPLAVGLCEHW